MGGILCFELNGVGGRVEGVATFLPKVGVGAAVAFLSPLTLLLFSP